MRIGNRPIARCQGGNAIQGAAGPSSNGAPSGGQCFGNLNFDAFPVREFIGVGKLGHLSAHQLWAVKCAVIQDLVTSRRVRKLLGKTAEAAMREVC